MPTTRAPLAMRRLSRARPFVFGPTLTPLAREAQTEGGRAAIAAWDGDPLRVLAWAGSTGCCWSSTCSSPWPGWLNVHNASPRPKPPPSPSACPPRRCWTAAVPGPDPGQNPGRMNILDLEGRAVIVDMAHNEASLLPCSRHQGLRLPGGRVLVMAGTAGDRSEELIRLGELAGREPTGW